MLLDKMFNHRNEAYSLYNVKNNFQCCENDNDANGNLK